MRAAVLVLVGLLWAGCIDAFDPQVGQPLADLCVDEDSDPARAVRFADVAAILQDRCTRCHTPEGRSPIGFEVSGLDMSTYDTLRSGGAVSRDGIIMPGRPCSSIIVQKVKEYPPFGARMPLSGPPFLTAAQIQAIADWIAEGAPRE